MSMVAVLVKVLPPEKNWSAVKLPLAAPPALIDKVPGTGVTVGPLGVSVRVRVGVALVGAALSALSTALYAAFFCPLELKSSGFCEARHESLSRTPQTVMPRQRETARQSLTM